MIAALLLGWGVLAGLHKAHVLLIAGALLVPVPLACVIAVHVWRSRPRPSTRATIFCEAVSGELRSGASLRGALEYAAKSVDAMPLARLCREGAPLPHLAAAVRSEFDAIGPEAATVIEHASRLGGPAASLFDEIGALALARVEVTFEVRSAMAPARATAAVLLIAPMIALGFVVQSGRLGSYLATTTQRASALFGLGMVVVGFLAIAVVLRRSR